MGRSLTNLNVEPNFSKYGIMHFSVVYSTFSAGTCEKTDQADDDPQIAKDSNILGGCGQENRPTADQGLDGLTGFEAERGDGSAPLLFLRESVFILEKY